MAFDYTTRSAVIIISEMRAFLILTSLLLGVGTTASAAQRRPVPPADGPASYYFMLGRHLEDENKIDDAIAAHQKAIALEPDSAELRAELAALYVRQDRLREGIETAEAALERDSANREANKIIGTVYAALSDQRRPFRAGDDPARTGPRRLQRWKRAGAISDSTSTWN